MHVTALVTTLLAAAPALAIPPEDFGFPSAPNDTMLGVTFNPGTNRMAAITEAELIGPQLPAVPPQLTLDASRYRSIATYNGAYLAMMVDPDASTPQNPTSRFLLHWMAPNLTAGPSATGILSNTTPAVVDYMRPMPPSYSDPHRYILYAFQQPSNFSVPESFRGFSATNRTHFNVTQFIAEAGLQQPAAANYFFCQDKAGTPPDFTATAGASFPGGNGGAVTAGLGSPVTPMASATGTQSASGAMQSAIVTAGAEARRGAGLAGVVAAVGAAAAYAL